MRELKPNCPPELAKLVMDLLAKDPKDRPASAAVVAATRRNPEADGLMQELRHSGEELSRTGNNLNQMALRANMAGQVPEREMLWGLLEDYRQVMETMKRAIAHVLDL